MFQSKNAEYEALLEAKVDNQSTTSKTKYWVGLVLIAIVLGVVLYFGTNHAGQVFSENVEMSDNSINADDEIINPEGSNCRKAALSYSSCTKEVLSKTPKVEGSEKCIAICKEAEAACYSYSSKKSLCNCFYFDCPYDLFASMAESGVQTDLTPFELATKTVEEPTVEDELNDMEDNDDIEADGSNCRKFVDSYPGCEKTELERDRGEYNKETCLAYAEEANAVCATWKPKRGLCILWYYECPYDAKKNELIKAFHKSIETEIESDRRHSKKEDKEDNDVDTPEIETERRHEDIPVETERRHNKDNKDNMDVSADGEIEADGNSCRKVASKYSSCEEEVLSTTTVDGTGRTAARLCKRACASQSAACAKWTRKGVCSCIYYECPYAFMKQVFNGEQTQN